MLIDVHCHLLSEKLDDKRTDIIRNCEKNRIIIVNSTIHPGEVERSLELSKKFGNVFTTVGLSASETEESLLDDTLALARRHRDKIVAIGEVGLDYHWVKDEAGREKERQNFRKFIELSDELQLPLVVHSRDAEDDTLSMLRKEKKPALLHCFSGSVEQAMEAIGMGCLISIPTSVAFSREKQKLAEELPLESLVLETDAPYLSPFRGKTNTPENIKICCEKVSVLKKTDLSKVMETTTKNALGFFNLEV